ncbi:hypothetical protein ACJJTC_003280 [Scirpophaga incertulas]
MCIAGRTPWHKVGQGARPALVCVAHVTSDLLPCDEQAGGRGGGGGAARRAVPPLPAARARRAAGAPPGRPAPRYVPAALADLRPPTSDLPCDEQAGGRGGGGGAARRAVPPLPAARARRAAGAPPGRPAPRYAGGRGGGGGAARRAVPPLPAARARRAAGAPPGRPAPRYVPAALADLRPPTCHVTSRLEGVEAEAVPHAVPYRRYRLPAHAALLARHLAGPHLGRGGGGGAARRAVPPLPAARARRAAGAPPGRPAPRYVPAALADLRPPTCHVTSRLEGVEAEAVPHAVPYRRYRLPAHAALLARHLAGPHLGTLEGVEAEAVPHAVPYRRYRLPAHAALLARHLAGPHLGRGGGGGAARRAVPPLPAARARRAAGAPPGRPAPRYVPAALADLRPPTCHVTSRLEGVEAEAVPHAVPYRRYRLPAHAALLARHLAGPHLGRGGGGGAARRAVPPLPAARARRAAGAPPGRPAPRYVPAALADLRPPTCHVTSRLEGVEAEAVPHAVPYRRYRLPAHAALLARHLAGPHLGRGGGGGAARRAVPPLPAARARRAAGAPPGRPAPRYVPAALADLRPPTCHVTSRLEGVEAEAVPHAVPYRRYRLPAHAALLARHLAGPHLGTCQPP